MIELVMVIVIMGILAAGALPRFSNLSDSAQVAANKQFATALSASLNSAHVAWIAAGASGATTVTLEGVGFSMNSSGWCDGNGMGFTAGNNCKFVTGNVSGTGIFIMNVIVANGVCASCHRASGLGSVCNFAQQDANSNPTGHGVYYDLASGSVTTY